MLTREARAEVVGRHIWDDHHKISTEDARAVFAAAQSADAEALVMTEKDAVKWPEAAESGKLPVYALRIEIAVEQESEFLREVIGRLEKGALSK